MDCLSCLDQKTIPDKEWDFDQFGHPEDLDIGLNLHNYFYLYVVAGCPFSAWPWCVLAFYGLMEQVQVHILFPAATSNCQWFFYPGPYDGSYEEYELAKQWTPEGKIESKKENNSL